MKRLVDYYSIIDKNIYVKIIDCANNNVLYEGGITTPYNDLDNTLMHKEVVKISASYITRRKNTTILVGAPSNLVDITEPILDIYIDTKTAIEKFIWRIIDRAIKKAIDDKIESKDLFFSIKFFNTSNKDHIWDMPMFSFDDRINALSELDDDYKYLLDIYGDAKFVYEISVTESNIVDAVDLEYVKSAGRRVYTVSININPDF